MNETYLYVLLLIILFFAMVFINMVAFEVSMAQAFILPVVSVIMFGGWYAIEKEQESSLEESLKNMPFEEIQTDALAILSKEHQKKDGVKAEHSLFISKEEHQETAYFDLASLEGDKTDKSYRFPAYVQYGDVEVAHVRYQLVKGDIFNAVVTLPKEEEKK